MPADPLLRHATYGPVVVHDHPREKTTWRDRISLETLAAMIDKLGDGQRLYFTYFEEWRVVALAPSLARLGVVGGDGVVDLHGHSGSPKSRGRLVADELRGYYDAKLREAMEAPADFQLISVDLIPEEQVVYPFPTGRLQCRECKGTGKVVLFQLPEECEPCAGTGWSGGKRHKESSENEAGDSSEKTSPPESEKDDS